MHINVWKNHMFLLFPLVAGSAVFVTKNLWINCLQVSAVYIAVNT